MHYVVVVTFVVKSESLADFLPLMHANARASLAHEEGCLQFDVATDPDRVDEVFLYELYTNREAFDLHLVSTHFNTFDAAVSNMIASKEVRTYAQVTQ